MCALRSGHERASAWGAGFGRPGLRFAGASGRAFHWRKAGAQGWWRWSKASASNGPVFRGQSKMGSLPDCRPAQLPGTQRHRVAITITRDTETCPEAYIPKGYENIPKGYENAKSAHLTQGARTPETATRPRLCSGKCSATACSQEHAGSVVCHHAPTRERYRPLEEAGPTDPVRRLRGGSGAGNS